VIVLAVLSFVTAVAWIPLALRFKRNWNARKNPVSMALAGSMLLFAYQEVMFTLAVTEQTTWFFFAVATHILTTIGVANMYLSFKWSAEKSNGAQRPTA